MQSIFLILINYVTLRFETNIPGGVSLPGDQGAIVIGAQNNILMLFTMLSTDQKIP